jgi:tyrosine-specific transport protein
LINTNIFLTALRYAGGIGTVVLFAILPAGMVWSGRYYKNFGNYPLLPGGRFSLALVIIIALAIMLT